MPSGQRPSTSLSPAPQPSPGLRAFAANQPCCSLLLCADGQVAVDEATVIRQVIGKQRAQTFDVIAPVAVHLARDAKPRHQLRARRLHAEPRRVAGGLVERAVGRC